MGRPKAYDDGLRIALVEAAAQLLADEGIGAVTTRRVAAAVGTSTTAIYSLIGSKDELFREMLREGFRRLADHLASVAPTDDPLVDLGALGAEYHAMAVESPHLYNVMFAMSWSSFEPDAADRKLAAGTLQVLVDAVARAVDAGLLDGDPNDLALELWSFNHGVTSLGLTGMLGPPRWCAGAWPTAAAPCAGATRRSPPRADPAPHRSGRVPDQASPLWCWWA